MAPQAALMLLALTQSICASHALSIHKDNDDKVTDDYEPNPKEIYYQDSVDLSKEKNRSGLVLYSRMIPMVVKSPRGDGDFWPLRHRPNLTLVGANEQQKMMLIGTDGMLMSRQTRHVNNLCKLWQRSNKEEGHIFEVGAGIGDYTIPLSECARSFGQVWAVETDEHKLDMLRTSMIANFAWNTVVLPYSFVPSNTRKRTTGDALVKRSKELKKTFLMKISLPGMEEEFLRGSTNYFEEYPPAFVLLETNPELLKQKNRSIDTLFEWLDGYNFHVNATSDDVDTPTFRSVLFKYGRPSEHKQRLKELSPKWGMKIGGLNEWDDSIPKPH